MNRTIPAYSSDKTPPVRLGGRDLMACLSAAERAVIEGRPPGVERTALLRALACHRLGTGARAKWVNGLEHLREELINPGHFMELLAVASRTDVYDVLDLVDEIGAGQHEGEKVTDPRLYRILHDAADKFKARGYDDLPHDEIMDFFESHPVRPNRRPDPEKGLAALIRRVRLAKGVSQEDLAARCGLSRRAVVKLENGESVSGRSLARTLDNLGILDALAAVEPGAVARQRAPMRRRGQAA